MTNQRNPPSSSVVVVVVVVDEVGTPIRLVVEVGPSASPPGDVIVHPFGTVTPMRAGFTRGTGLYVRTVLDFVSVGSMVKGW